MELENLFKKTVKEIATLGLASILTLVGTTEIAGKEKQQSKPCADTSIYYCLPPLICSDKQYYKEIPRPAPQAKPSADTLIYYCLPPLICSNPQAPDSNQEKSTGVHRIAPEKIRPQYLRLNDIKRI